MKRSRLLGAFAAVTMVGAFPHYGAAARSADETDRPLQELGDDFASGHVAVNGTTLHYVRGGTGPALVLIHGFPQDWSAFHEIMPRLAKRFTVISIDLRGVGRSAPSWKDYSISVLTEDIRQLLNQLGLEQIYVAGQDNGGILAYAFARNHPELTRGSMIIDVPLPGIDPWNAVKADPAHWHFAFHQTKDLPEMLIADHQYAYFREFFDRFCNNMEAVTDEEVRRYVAAYKGPERLKAGLAFYRTAYPTSEIQIPEYSDGECPPIVLAGGERSMGPAYPATAEALRGKGCYKVVIEVISGSGHWVADEQPDAIASLLEKHALPID